MGHGPSGQAWRVSILTGYVACCLVAAAGCSSKAPSAGDAPPRAEAAPPTSSRPRIVALGDSLTAGLGLDISQSYPSRLQQRIDHEGLNYEVINAGVSGDTSAGGLRRLDWSLDGDVRLLVLALGANDALRGLPTDQLERNLARMVERAQARGVTVVLAGMEAPPNFGNTYQVAFHQVYARLVERYNLAFVPFLLAGVAGSDRLNQPDGIHPNAEGAEIVAGNVWTVVRPLLKGQTARD